MTLLYGLFDSLGNLRYIGKTVQPPSKRLADHLSEMRRGVKSHRCNWLRATLARGERPSIQILARVRDDDENAMEVEMIQRARLRGHDLVNGTDGGDGNRMTPEVRAKVSAALRGRPKSPEAVAKGAIARRGRKVGPMSEERKQKISMALKGNPALAHRRGKSHSPATRAKLREAWVRRKGM